MCGTPYTSGTTTPDTVHAPSRLSLLATAKRDAAKKSLYARFFRGPVLGPEVEVDGTNGRDPSSSAPIEKAASPNVQIPHKSSHPAEDDKKHKKHKKRRKIEEDHLTKGPEMTDGSLISTTDKKPKRRKRLSFTGHDRDSVPPGVKKPKKRPKLEKVRDDGAERAIPSPNMRRKKKKKKVRVIPVHCKHPWELDSCLCYSNGTFPICAVSASTQARWEVEGILCNNIVVIRPHSIRVKKKKNQNQTRDID